MDFGDLTNLKRVVGESNIELISVDFSGCLNLEEIIMNGPILETFFLPQTNTLEIFSCPNAMLTDIDLSNYNELTLIDVRNNELESLNVANGNNVNVTSFNSTGNPNLSCIIVDDIAYSEENWTLIDPTTEFCEENLSVEEVVIKPVVIYPNPAQAYFQMDVTNHIIHKVEIIDLSGKKVKSFAQPLQKYPIHELSNGVYLLKLNTQKGSFTQKLIVE